MTLLASDPALPARDRLLDGDGFARAASAALERSVEPVERLRTKYRVGESLRVLYSVRLEANGPPAWLAARVNGAAEPTWWLFPGDTRLPGLSALANDPTALIDDPSAHVHQVVAYAPHKSATVQYRTQTNQVAGYIKLYARDEGSRVRRLYERFQAAGPEVRLPRLLGGSDAYQSIALEALHGPRLADLGGPERATAYRAFGSALARLHQLPVAGLERYTRLDGPRLQQAARVIGLVRPELRLLARLAVTRLVEHQPSVVLEDVCLHGDVHPKNAIETPGGMALIDLDQASVGPAAADVGSFLAGLLYASTVGALRVGEADSLAEAFLTGYAAIGGRLPPDVLRWHVAAALLAERALRSVNRVRCAGLVHLPQLLELVRITA